MTNPKIRQASAVAIQGRALLIEGPPGSGKTTLALSLIDRGASLIGDDGVELTEREGYLVASPPPNTAGLIEIRNVGLVKRPCVSAQVSLILTIAPDAPRYLEQAETIPISGHDIPRIEFARYDAADPIRAEAALDRYGLPSLVQ